MGVWIQLGIMWKWAWSLYLTLLLADVCFTNSAWTNLQIYKFTNLQIYKFSMFYKFIHGPSDNLAFEAW